MDTFTTPLKVALSYGDESPPLSQFGDLPFLERLKAQKLHLRSWLKMESAREFLLEAEFLQHSEECCFEVLDYHPASILDNPTCERSF